MSETTLFFFHYFELPLNGTPGMKNIGGIKITLMFELLVWIQIMDYRIQEQLEWLDSILSITTSDTIIDFVFAQLHHPHHSELWPEGNTFSLVK